MNKENADHYHWGDGCDGWHLVRTATLSVILERVPAGASEALHYHQQAEQFFFVLQGVATLAVDGEIHRLLPQQGLHVPAGSVHQLRNEQSDDLLFTVTSTPPSHGDRILI